MSFFFLNIKINAWARSWRSRVKLREFDWHLNNLSFFQINWQDRKKGPACFCLAFSFRLVTWSSWKCCQDLWLGLETASGKFLNYFSILICIKKDCKTVTEKTFETCLYVFIHANKKLYKKARLVDKIYSSSKHQQSIFVQFGRRRNTSFSHIKR